MRAGEWSYFSPARVMDEVRHFFQYTSKNALGTRAVAEIEMENAHIIFAQATYSFGSSGSEQAHVR